MFYSTEALERIWDYLHTGDPTPETADDFRNGDWDRYEDKDMTIASAALAIATDARIREALDWDRLVSETCMTKEELIADVARAAWVEYWDGMVQTGWFEDRFVEETFEEESNMKYHVFDANQGYTILDTDSLAEALKARDNFEAQGGTCEACIWDHNHNEIDAEYELEVFVSDRCDENLQAIDSYPEARATINQWTRDGIEVPEDLTDEVLIYLLDRELAERKAAEPADQLRDSLQRALDVAWADEDRAWEEFKSTPCNDPSDYEHAKAYLEGCVFAIEAAGYRVDPFRKVVKA